MKLWKIFCVLTASEGQMGPYGRMAYGPGPYGPRMGGHDVHQVHPNQMGQGHHNSDQNHGHGQVPRYIPGQKNVFVRENNAVRKASIAENSKNFRISVLNFLSEKLRIGTKSDQVVKKK